MNSTSTDIKKIRQFGLVALIFFGCLCLTGIWLKRPVPIFLFGSLSLLGIGFILWPDNLMPIYNTWIKIAHFLGRIFTKVILTLTYYLVITPMAIIKRVLGGRPITLKPDKNRSSYWVTRNEPSQPKERFIKRY